LRKAEAMRLLVTRPQPDAERTAAALRRRGHSVVAVPLVRIELIADAAIDDRPWAAILITSANAAAAVATDERKRALLDVPVFAVGDRSAEAMRAAGFAEVVSAGGAVADLARLVAERIEPKGALLYLAGKGRAGDLAGDLGVLGFAVQTAIVYRAVAAATLPQDALEALAAGLDGVLHFSRRSAEAYVKGARAAGALSTALAPAQFCLSEQIAVPLRHAGAAMVRVAPRPNEAALIELICGNAS
jgi:uroporphyrinogen-III synthase